MNGVQLLRCVLGWEMGAGSKRTSNCIPALSSGLDACDGCQDAGRWCETMLFMNDMKKYLIGIGTHRETAGGIGWSSMYWYSDGLVVMLCVSLVSGVVKVMMSVASMFMSVLCGVVRIPSICSPHSTSRRPSYVRRAGGLLHRDTWVSDDGALERRERRRPPTQPATALAAARQNPPGRSVARPGSREARRQCGHRSVAGNGEHSATVRTSQRGVRALRRTASRRATSSTCSPAPARTSRSATI